MELQRLDKTILYAKRGGGKLAAEGAGKTKDKGYPFRFKVGKEKGGVERGALTMWGLEKRAWKDRERRKQKPRGCITGAARGGDEERSHCWPAKKKRGRKGLP